ncbi:hypothetical protein [Salisaeta longa]|uniref:hypothetical protein n=1 Tax=Salisaeta longa TaxID=503170 RepID=UPI00041792B6|nr:hypothetical protein [Salisaeta longa]
MLRSCDMGSSLAAAPPVMLRAIPAPVSSVRADDARPLRHHATHVPLTSQHHPAPWGHPPWMG